MSVSFTHLEPPSETTFLRERVNRLRSSMGWASDAISAKVRAKVEEAITRCEQRLDLGVDYTIVALAGGTGSGKSSLFNAIARTDFAMPGVGIPGFAEHAKAIADAGIYDLAIHHDQILQPVIMRDWGLESIEGLSPEAEESRERVITYIGRVGKVGARLASRRESKAAAAAVGEPAPV